MSVVLEDRGHGSRRKRAAHRGHRVGICGLIRPRNGDTIEKKSDLSQKTDTVSGN